MIAEDGGESLLSVSGIYGFLDFKRKQGKLVSPDEENSLLPTKNNRSAYN